MEGYHSPQVDVAVRLNTNEAPEPPPAGFARRAGRRGRRARLAPLPRPLATGAARGDRRPPRRRPRAGLRRQRLQRGAPDAVPRLRRRRAAPSRCSSRPTRCTATSPASPAPAVAVGERADDLALDLDEVRRVLAEADAGHHVPLLAQQPHRDARATRPPCARCSTWRPGLLVVDEAYGQFAPWSALELVDDDRPLVVTRTYSKTWSMAAARLGYLVGPRVRWSPSSTRSCCRTTSTRSSRPPAARARLRRRHAHPRRRRWSRSAAAWWPACPSCRSRCGRRRPTSCCSGPTARDGADVWQALLDRSVLVRDCSSWPRLDGCLRVTIGTPAEDDAFLAALEEVLT